MLRCFLSNAETNNCVFSLWILYYPGQEKEGEPQWAVLRSWEIWVFLSEFKVPSYGEIPDWDLWPASSFIAVLLILHLPRTRHENKSCSILRWRCLIGWSRHKNTHNSWFGVFLRGFNISEVVLCVCFLLAVWFKKHSRRKRASLTALIVFVSTQQQLFASVSSPCCCSQTSCDLLVYGCLCAESSVRSDPQVSRGLGAFQSTVSLLERSLDLWPPPLTSTTLTQTKLKLKNMLVVPVSLLSFLSVTFCVSLRTLGINICSESCEDPIAQTTLDHQSEVVWPACGHIHQSDLYVVHCDVTYIFVLSQPAKVSSRCLWTLFQLIWPVATISPDSLCKSPYFKSCFMWRSLTNFVKHFLWQILTHWCLLVNSALNVIHESNYHPQFRQAPFTNQLILGVVE